MLDEQGVEFEVEEAEVEAVEETPVAEVKPARPKIVSLVEHAGDDVAIFSDEFFVHLQSVSGKDYEFTDAGKCLSWLTRRGYNGEALSAEAQLLHSVLGQGRTYHRIMKLADALHAAISTATLSADADRRRIEKNATQIRENVDSLVGDVFNNIAGRLDELAASAVSIVTAEVPVTGEGEEAAADYSDMQSRMNDVEAKLAAALKNLNVTFGEVFPADAE